MAEFRAREESSSASEALVTFPAAAKRHKPASAPAPAVDGNLALKPSEPIDEDDLTEF